MDFRGENRMAVHIPASPSGQKARAYTAVTLNVNAKSPNSVCSYLVNQFESSIHSIESK